MSEHEQNFPTGTVQENKVNLSTDSRILREQSLRVVYDREKNKNGIEVTEEFTALSEIFRLHKLAKKLLEATAENFCAESPLSRHWLNWLKLPVMPLFCFPQHKFSPYVELYMEYFSNITQDPAWNEPPRGVSVTSRRLNLIKIKTIAMREAFESTDFKKKIKSVQRSVNKNRQNLLEYYRGLFKRDKTLLVLRLNLGYREEERQRQEKIATVAFSSGLMPLSNIDINPSFQGAQQLMPWALQGFSLQDVILHRDELIRNLRTTLKQKLRGYTWKLEYTTLKGYQYHVVIFLDATLAQAKMPYDKAIGQHWEDVITQGHGLCYSQDESKESYRFCATGVKNQADPDLADDLAKVVDYLTRPDRYIQLVLPDKHRTLGKGGI